MAHLATHTNPQGHILRSIGIWVKASFEAYLRRKTRRDAIHTLQKLSDGDLARLGTDRAHIPAFVFRDRHYR
ncbi:MAG: hypothetical protein AAF678_03465 [Pseudomonadota bacterium]